MTGNNLIIVIDAANIGWSHGRSKNCSGVGLLSTIEYFRERNFNPIAFLPNRYLYNPKQPKRLISELDKVILEVEKGFVIPVPSRDDDDLYMITFAQSKSAKLVSNDLYRDYIASSEDEKAESWVRDNVVSYTFIGDEFFPNPKYLKYIEGKKDETSPEKSVESITKLVADQKVDSILDEITIFDNEGDVEKELGFRYYCPICGEGFKKWGHAYNHKRETGHGAYYCGECQDILPSPKTAKEHQEITGHTTLIGKWIGQHDMRVKEISGLTVDFIRSSNMESEEILKDLIRKKETQKHDIWRFTKKSQGRSFSWPKEPQISAQIIHEFESFRGTEITWKECKHQILEKVEVTAIRINGILRTLQHLFQPGWSQGQSGEMTGSWTNRVEWDAVRIDGAIFENIRQCVAEYEWGDGESAPEGWIEQITDYLEDVKIYYARLG